MSERSTYLEQPLSGEVELLCRVFGISLDEVLQRVIEAGVDAVLADDQVRAAVDALRAIDARRATPNRSEPVAASAAPAPASAGATSQPARIAPALEEDDAAADADIPQRMRAGHSPGRAVLTDDARRRAASHIKDVRIRRGLTQQQVGDHLGIANATVSLAERAGHNVSQERLKLLVEWASQPDERAA